MRLFDEGDLESVKAEGRAEGMKAGAQNERTRLVGVLDTPEAKRDLGAALGVALADPTVTAENIRERLETQPAKGSATLSSREIYSRLNAANGPQAESGHDNPSWEQAIERTNARVTARS